MDEMTIQREVDKMTMTFSPDLLSKVAHFLRSSLEPIWRHHPHLHVPAAAAIMCEITKLPTVGNLGLTGTGIKIENVMRHLEGVSKEAFLDTIELQISLWDHDHHALSQKVQYLKISLRMFKKYKEIFDYLSVKTHKQCIPACIREDLLAFFWIVYLLLKSDLGILEDIGASTRLMVWLLEEIFCSTICKLPFQMLRSHLSENQNFPSILEIPEPERDSYHSSFRTLLETTLSSRNVAHSFTRQFLKENTCILKRLIDDLSNSYEKEYEKLPEGRYIEEITYLQLSKNLTPQAFRIRQPDEDISPICRVLNFDEDEKDETQEGEQVQEDKYQTDKKKTVMREILEDAPEKQQSPIFFSFSHIPAARISTLSPSKPVQPLTMSPLTWGVTKSTWVKKMLSEGDAQTERKLEKALNNKNVSFQSFKEFSLSRIAKQVESLTAHSLDLQLQKKSIWKVFVWLAWQYEDKKGIPQFESILCIRSLLCLAGCLYNYLMRSLNIEFQKYCQIYELDLQKGFHIIYQIGKHLEIPPFARQYLYDLEKQVILKQIWDSRVGFQIIQSCANAQSGEKSIVFKRLTRHAFERVKEVCTALSLDLQLVAKIDRLLTDLLSKRAAMFQETKFDDIIKCCIAATLSQNENRYYSPLSALLCNNLVGPEEMTMTKFYNSVFLRHVKSLENSEFVCQEIQEAKLSTSNAKDLVVPGISKIGGAGAFQGGRPAARLGLSGGNNLQKRMMQKLKKVAESPVKEEGDSPYFGIVPLKRTFTFGNGQL